ncbi:MAG: metallophosphoesterase [Oscillospiraceae bacterium]|nr:metallophosphoesterase [Oscillospiraceae bacterium]
MLASLFVFSVIAVLLLFLHSRILEITVYEFAHESVAAPFTIAFIADHHNTKYGAEQESLLTLIREGEPDLILLGGDIFCHVGNGEESWHLVHGLLQLDVPVIYVSGNHEMNRSDLYSITQQLRRLGVIVPTDEAIVLDIRGNTVAVAGQNIHRDGEVFNAVSDDALTIMLTHFPEIAKFYSDFDLIFAGHAHGGQVRVPLLFPNGLYAPGQGRFPEYTGGSYSLEGGCTLIVSRGLSVERSAAFRLFNRPELVFVEAS